MGYVHLTTILSVHEHYYRKRKWAKTEKLIVCAAKADKIYVNLL